MRRIRFAIFAFLLGFGAAAEIASAGEAEAWAALRAGRHVALMRHADAPGGFGDPPGFRIEDCATQRNLSAKGRADARKDRRAAQVGRDRGRENPRPRRGAAASTPQRCCSSDRSKPSRHSAMWSCCAINGRR